MATFAERYENVPEMITPTDDQRFQFTDFKFYFTFYKIKEEVNEFRFGKLL